MIIRNQIVVILILLCVMSRFTLMVDAKNHNTSKRKYQKSFMQKEQSSSKSQITIKLKKNTPNQKDLVDKINLLIQHQAFLLQTDSYSYYEFDENQQLIKQERKSFENFIQTDLQSMKNKQSIDLRNKDNTYFTGQISIGEQPFDVIFDTGSAFVFVNSDYCVECMKNHHYYTETQTLEEENLDVIVHFGTGQITGLLSRDIIQLGDIQLNKGTFAQITEETGSIFLYSTFDGIVGLSRQTLVDKVPTMIEQLSSSSQLDRNIFSFFLERDLEGSQVILGGIDNTKYDGELVYHKVLDGTNFWTLPCKQILVGDQDTGLCSEDQICRLVVDTGTSFFTGPTTKITSLLQQIQYENLGCKNLYDLPPVTFVVEDQHYVIYPNEYILTTTRVGVDPFYEHSNINEVMECMISFYGLDINDQGNENSWILGDIFMGKFYTVFDVDNQSIGFAKSINYKQYIH